MAIGRINEVAALTGFSYEKMYGRFAGQKNIGRNNEVAIRRGSTVGSDRQRVFWLAFALCSMFQKPCFKRPEDPRFTRCCRFKKHSSKWNIIGAQDFDEEVEFGC